MTYFPLINKKIGSLAVGLCLAGAVCLPAEAVLTRYSFSGGSLSGGGTLSGFFDFDDQTTSFFNYQINVTPGTSGLSSTVPDFTYTQSNSSVSAASSTGFTMEATGLSGGEARTLALAFSTLDGSDATITQSSSPFTTPSNEYYTPDGSGSIFRGLTGDLDATASPVPVPLESDALSVVVAGTFLSGAYWLKRRRSAKSVAELSLSDDENN